MLHFFHSSFRCLDTPLFTDDYEFILQPSRGYMEEMVDLVATLEGMVLRREAQLSVAGIQVPFSFLAFIILLMTC